MRSTDSILVLISARGGGDWSPVVALAAGLNDRGYQLRVLCDASTEKAISSTGLQTIRVPPELEQGVYINPRWVQELTASGQGLTHETPNPLIGWAEASAPAVSTQVRELKPKAIISSLFCMGLADLLAAELGVPWCFVNPSFYFGEDGQRPWDADFASLSAGMFRYWFLPLSQKANLVLHATDPQFDFQPSSLPANHKYVGPLLWETPDAESLYKADPSLPSVLISLSTGPQEGELAIARAAIRSLKDEPVRVLVTLAPGHDRTELGDIPGNVQLADYVPHSEVLENCRLVVSHAGHGIVVKALYHGVPMVLVPWGRDQPGVAARAEAMGVAAVVRRDEFDDDSLDRAIRTVLDDRRYTDMAQGISKRIQSDDPVERACVHIEALLVNAM